MLEYPFLRPAFLKALENSGSVSRETGWDPQHIEPSGPDYRVFMPLYVKDHSWGEYVFDWSWADAYQRNGLPYYPKLVSAIPFTPATGPRVIATGTAREEAYYPQLFAEVKALAAERGASGWHLLFPQQWQQAMLPELLHRTGVQFHWHNRDYQGFDDFLATLVSRKRKMIKRERRNVGDQGLTIALLEGDRISTELWDFFYDVYRLTYLKRSGNTGYLNREFFAQISTAMPEQIAMSVAYEDQQPVACALYFFDDDTLFGRYWGCLKAFEHLHFELCYYQGIELAIAKKLQKFDAGAQGEHKIIRGFEPVITHSLHWIADPRFAAAIADFLERERHHNQLYQEQARSMLPYKTNL